MVDNMWIWGAIGIALLAAEAATGTIYILWFGIAALCMAIAVWLFPDMSIPLQLLIYAVLSLTALAIWKYQYKKADKPYNVGQAQGDELGRVGIISEACGPQQKGRIRFTQGVMGSSEWSAISDQTIEVGQQAKITAIEGNSLRVTADI